MKYFGFFNKINIKQKSFGFSLIFLFFSFILLTTLSQFFYKSSINLMHQSVLSAVQIAKEIHTAENFHNSVHNMLFISSNITDINREHFLIGYNRQKKIAADMLNLLIERTEQRNKDIQSSAITKISIVDVEQLFKNYCMLTDYLISQKGLNYYMEEEEKARELFDIIFRSYIDLIHHYHNVKLKEIESEAHNIYKYSAQLFIVQLTAGIIITILAVFFIIHRLLRPYNSVKKYAFTDGLTGLHNRRFLDIKAIPDMNNNIQEEIPFCISLMDIDKFKVFNDTYGHQSGDKVIKEIAILLQSGVRRSDAVIRYGGEEFLLLLQNVIKDDALPILQKIRTNIEKTAFFLSDLDVPVTVTGSFGAAFYPDDGDDIQLLIKKADERLYSAKKDGRNLVRG